MHRSVLALTLLAAALAQAQPQPLPDLERPPAPVVGQGAAEAGKGPSRPQEPVPPPNAGGIEPEITITHRGQVIVQEYRINGRLYMIRVIPPIGFPYYLVDTNADGVWDTRLNDLAPIAPPQWILFSW